VWLSYFRFFLNDNTSIIVFTDYLKIRMQFLKDKLILNTPSSTEKFKEINISSIKSLDKELNLLLKDYIINDKIFECAIISKNIEKFKGSNFKEIEKAIFKEIYDMGMNDNMKEEFIVKINNISVSEFDTNLKELSILISNQNNNVIIPKVNEYHSEKELILN
jgi:hypothetical protein